MGKRIKIILSFSPYQFATKHTNEVVMLQSCEIVTENGLHLTFSPGGHICQEGDKNTNAVGIFDIKDKGGDQIVITCCNVCAGMHMSISVGHEKIESVAIRHLSQAFAAYRQMATKQHLPEEQQDAMVNAAIYIYLIATNGIPIY